MQPRFSFNHVPFLYVFMFTFSGIIFSHFFEATQDLLLFLLSGLLIIAVEINFRNIASYKLSTITFPILFFFLGIFSTFISNYSKVNDSLIDGETMELNLLIKDVQKTKNGNWKGKAEIKSMNGNDEIVNENIIFYANNIISLNIGDLIKTKTKLNEFSNKGNPGEFNSRTYWQSKGIRFYTFLNEFNLQKLDKNRLNFLEKNIQKLKDNASTQLENSVEGQSLAIAKALLLGDKSFLDNETKEVFSNSGAMHLLAVSGLHIGIILILLNKFFSLFSFLLSRQNAVLFSIVLLWIYALVTGLPASIVRSVFMFSCIGLAQISGRGSNSINILFFTAFIVLILYPNTWMDIGFQLSYLAMFGIYLIYPIIEKWFRFKTKLFQFIWQGMAVAIAAQLFTFPLVLYYFHQFPNYFILSNLILILLAGILLTAGFLMILMNKIIFFGSFIAKLFIGLLFVLVVYLKQINELPGSLAQGFEFSFWLVPFILVFIIILFRSVFFTLKWSLFFILLISFLSPIFQNRYRHLSESHIVFFNDTNLTFAIKKDDQILAFIDTDKPLEFSSINLLKNYSKLYPGSLKIIKLDSLNGKVSFGEDIVTWNKKREIFTVSYNGQEIKINYSNFVEANDGSRYLYMPWVNHQKSLKNGAIKFDLN